MKLNMLLIYKMLYICCWVGIIIATTLKDWKVSWGLVILLTWLKLHIHIEEDHK